MLRLDISVTTSFAQQIQTVPATPALMECAQVVTTLRALECTAMAKPALLMPTVFQALATMLSVHSAILLPAQPCFVMVRPAPKTPIVPLAPV